MSKLSKEKRSRIMSAIHSRNTKPELIVRRYLWAHGFRYRLNCPRLHGHPDIVLRKYRTSVFVNGCFWHGHNCKEFRPPKTNVEYWLNKIERNKIRDKEEQKLLLSLIESTPNPQLDMFTSPSMQLGVRLDITGISVCLFIRTKLSHLFEVVFLAVIIQFLFV